MGIKFQKKSVVLNFKSEKPKKYVARNVVVGSISFEKLCNEVSQRCGTHRGQVNLVINGLCDVMSTFLEEGLSVKLGEFGSFRPSINAKSKDNSDDVNASTIIRKKIVFRPGKRLQRMLNEASIEDFTDDFDDDTCPAPVPPSPGGGSTGTAPDPGA